MKRIFSFPALVLPLVAVAQETADKGASGTMYGLAIGLVIFLALIGIYSVYERIRDWMEAKEERAEEEAKKLK